MNNINNSVHRLIYLLIVCSLNLACNKSITQKWDQNKTYTYHMEREYAVYSGYGSETMHSLDLIVAPNSVPENGVLYFGYVTRSAQIEKYNIELDNLISDYELASDFMLISGNFDSFLLPNNITIDYTQYQEYGYTWNDYQYYYHDDLQLYQINHYDNVETEIINMNNWIPVPFTFSDTVSTGQGTINAQITNVNALYVVARKYN